MEHKTKLLDTLTDEHTKLVARREELMAKVDVEREEYEEDNPNPILDEYVTELQSVVSHIFDLENAIRQIKNSDQAQNKKGETVKEGDVVTLKNQKQLKQYFITHSSDYVNPSLGIISASSPIGRALLKSKFGQKISLQLNGMNFEYELAP